MAMHTPQDYYQERLRSNLMNNAIMGFLVTFGTEGTDWLFWQPHQDYYDIWLDEYRN